MRVACFYAARRPATATNDGTSAPPVTATKSCCRTGGVIHHRHPRQLPHKIQPYTRAIVVQIMPADPHHDCLAIQDNYWRPPACKLRRNQPAHMRALLCAVG